jgi:hypothetical protein
MPYDNASPCGAYSAKGVFIGLIIAHIHDKSRGAWPAPVHVGDDPADGIAFIPRHMWPDFQDVFSGSEYDLARFQGGAYQTEDAPLYDRDPYGWYPTPVDGEGEPFILDPDAGKLGQPALEGVGQPEKLGAQPLGVWVAIGDLGPHQLQAMIPGEIGYLAVNPCAEIG